MDLLFSLVPIIAIVALFFFMSRKDKKQRQAEEDMRNDLRVGDEVTMTCGIIGKIVSIKDETLVLETSHDRTRIRFLRTAVLRVDVQAEDAQD